jgi:hypothetical protein
MKFFDEIEIDILRRVINFVDYKADLHDYHFKHYIKHRKDVEKMK